MNASPGIDLSHVTGFGSPLIESSKAFCGTWVDDGIFPPVALATANCTAVRDIQFCESTVKSLNPGLEASSDSRSHESWLESSVATPGSCGRRS